MIGSIGAGLGALGSGLGSVGGKVLGYASSALSSPLGQMGIGATFGAGGDMLQGVMNNYFGKKSSKYSSKQSYHYQRKLNQWLIPYQLEQQNKYAEEYQKMYSRNSPSWNVEGLRKAGLNPILAASGGFSATPAARPTASGSTMGTTGYQPSARGSMRFDPLTLKNLEILDKQNESMRLDNALKADNLKTSKAENEVKRLKSQAEYNVLKPIKGITDGNGKTVEAYVDSDGFKALQKAIRDDFDLRSEKYVRETIDAIFRYGPDVLKLLPIFRRKEILDTITKTIKTSPNGKKTTYETSTTHSPHL